MLQRERKTGLLVTVRCTTQQVRLSLLIIKISLKNLPQVTMSQVHSTVLHQLQTDALDEVGNFHLLKTAESADVY